MKEFWSKHKKAILISGGLFILLYVFYKYEQSQATAASPQDAASQLAAQTSPLISGGGGVVTTPSTYNPATNLPDFTSTAPTATQQPGTSQSGLPQNAPQNQPTQSQSPGVPTPSTTGNVPNPYSTGGSNNPYSVVDPNAYSTGQAQLAASHCQYPLAGGVLIPGVPVCQPNGSVPGDPRVGGLLPGQAGYADAVQASITQLQSQPGGDTQGVADLEALLAQYGTTGTGGVSEGSSVPAGTSSTMPVAVIPSNRAPVTGAAVSGGLPARSAPTVIAGATRTTGTGSPVAQPTPPISSVRNIQTIPVTRKPIALRPPIATPVSA